MIQESINQMLGALGLATKLNPELEKKRQLKDLKAGEKILKEEATIANKERVKTIANPFTTTQKRSELHSEAAKIEERQYQNYQKQFELAPSKDLFTKMMSAQRKASMSRTTANELTRQKIEDAVKQDQDFKKYRDSIILDSNSKPIEKEE